MNISIIIPTLQAELFLPSQVDLLKNQTAHSSQIIVIDSSSTDRTVAIAQEKGCRVEVIERKSFRHGRARNLAARQAQGEILIFLTQDVLPINEHFLSELTQPIRNGQVVAAYARQIAFTNASSVETFARAYNYPSQSAVRSLQDLPRLGIKTFFFSNTASAFERQAFWELGGFREDLIVNEDMEMCARILKHGDCIAYQAEAQVYHSHNYTLRQLFQRYFDIGVFFTQAGPIFDEISTNPEGRRFFREAASALIAQKQLAGLGRLLVESMVKLVAVQLGHIHPRLPRRIKRAFSGQPHFWD